MSIQEKRLYEKDTMSAEERLEKVIRLECPDRVPAALFIYYYAPFHVGIRTGDFMKNHDVYFNAIKQVYKDIGPWDIFYNGDSFSKIMYSFAAMMQALWPGIDLPGDVMGQTKEVQYMDFDDYEWIMKSGRFFNDLRFRARMMPRFCNEVKGYGLLRLMPTFLMEISRMVRLWRKDFKWFKEQGAAILMGSVAEMPFDTFSQARNIIQFSMDILKHQETVRNASVRLSKNFADTMVAVSRLLGVPRVQLFCHRTSNSFISPRQFESIAYPSLEMTVNRIIDCGMTPALHCDGDWLKNLKTLRRLPAKKVIIEFDGFTDMFRAKQEIGDRMCIYGDVPAEMLALGSPGEVEEYCHRLIEEVGAGGGFILASGCEVPYNAKPENLRAVVQSAVKYGYYV
ncbi:MAG: hypothetical protein KJ737_05320 [Proteobacteria bacterium]|nr:hypothetical protein [Pseudomonadota bacterium]